MRGFEMLVEIISDEGKVVDSAKMCSQDYDVLRDFTSSLEDGFTWRATPTGEPWFG